MLVLIVLSLIAGTFIAPLSNASPVVSSADTGTRSEWVRGVIEQKHTSDPSTFGTTKPLNHSASQ